MTIRNTSTQYGSVSKFFHWLIFILVFVLILVGFFWESAGAMKGTVINVHKLTGLTVLALVILRVLWTLSNPKPKIPNARPWEKIIEHVIHGFIYIALMGMPISGWIMVTSAGRPPHLLGYTLPMPGVAVDKEWAYLAGYVHFILACVLMGLVGLHILAALKHHFINHDNILKRMLPGKWD